MEGQLVVMSQKMIDLQSKYLDVQQESSKEILSLHQQILDLQLSAGKSE